MQWAMIDLIKNPPQHFADIVKQHFCMHAANILAETKKWCNETRGKSSEYKRAYDELKKLLTPMLPPPLPVSVTLTPASVTPADSNMNANANVNANVNVPVVSAAGWICPACTFMNPTIGPKCGVCESPFLSGSSFGTAVPVAAVAAGSLAGWNCVVCTYHNAESADQCDMCGSPP